MTTPRSDEPLDEAVEVSWNIYMERFKTQIYPVIFQAYKVPFDIALLTWGIAKLHDEVAELRTVLADDKEDL